MKISKRQQRILDAKSRPESETKEIRESERRPPEQSKFQKFTTVWDKWTLHELRRKRDLEKIGIS